MKNTDRIKMGEEMERCKNSPQYFFDNYWHVTADDLPTSDPDTIKKLWDAAGADLSKVDDLEGKIIITSTPQGPNYFYDLYIKSQK